MGLWNLKANKESQSIGERISWNTSHAERFKHLNWPYFGVGFTLDNWPTRVSTATINLCRKKRLLCMFLEPLVSSILTIGDDSWISTAFVFTRAGWTSRRRIRQRTSRTEIQMYWYPVFWVRMWWLDVARFKQEVLLAEYSTDRFARRGSGPSDLCRPVMTARKAGFGLIWLASCPDQQMCRVR